jgi:hypothetical protein
LHVEFSTSIARTDLDDYIRHLAIGVGCYDEDALNEYIVGKLAVDQIMWMDALVDGDLLGAGKVATRLLYGKPPFRQC